MMIYSVVMKIPSHPAVKVEDEDVFLLYVQNYWSYMKEICPYLCRV